MAAAARRNDDDHEDDGQNAEAKGTRAQSVDLKGSAIGWLFRQSPWIVMSFVLLIALVGLMYGGIQFGYYVVNTSIPAMMERVEKGHEKARTDFRESQQELLEKLRDERARDREWATTEREKDRSELLRMVLKQSTAGKSPREPDGT